MNKQTNQLNYIIFKDMNGNTCARNEKTGNIDFKGIDAATVINNISSSQIRTNIYIDNDTFVLNSPIIIRYPHQIQGAGNDATILQTSGTFDAIQILPVNAWDYDSLSIRNIALDGNSNGRYGLIFDGGIDPYISGKVVGCYFENIGIRNFTEFGIYENSNFGNTYINCKIMSNGMSSATKGGVCIFSNATTFIGGRIDWNGTGILARHGAGNSFYNCVIEGNEYHGVYAYSTSPNYYPQRYTLSECWFESNNIANAANIRDIFLADSTVMYWSMRNCQSSGNKVDYSVLTLGNYSIINNFRAFQKGIRFVAGRGTVIQTTLDPSSFPLSSFVKVIGDKYSNNILSDKFGIDSIGIKTIVIPHGLAITPNIQDCCLTVIQSTPVDDWAYTLLKVVSTDAINITTKINVSSASATIGAVARIALRI